MAEPAVLFKEKINYKQPGGAGYAAHQDAPAYLDSRQRVTCLLAIDAAPDTNSGCLEFASGRHSEGLIGLTEDGIVDPEVAAQVGGAVSVWPGHPSKGTEAVCEG